MSKATIIKLQPTTIIKSYTRSTLWRSNMTDCACGRRFRSDQALAQHQLDKARNGNAPSLCSLTREGGTLPAAAKSPRNQQHWRHAWIWTNVLNRNRPIQTIQQIGLEASSTPVSSAAAPELICTYNWQESRGARIHVPGYAPKWQDIPLPVTVQADKGVYAVDQDVSRVAKYPFEPIFQAAALMNPTFRFDDVDIVVNRNSLRKLLDFCNGRVRDSFTVKLLIVNNTLFVERCEKSATQLIRGSGQSGWGHNFEKTFTTFPADAGESSGHHRVLCYSLGHLRCAVRFEVDACYEASGEVDVDAHATESLLVRMGALSMSNSTYETAQDAQQPPSSSQGKVMPQSTAAELKTATKPKPLGQFLPQLWFGRTPWLIIGNHTKGTFDSVKITRAANSFERWETEHQKELQKMATVLDQLREAVKKNRGMSCIAVCERDSSPRVIKVYGSMETRRALPENLIAQFWASAS